MPSKSIAECPTTLEGKMLPSPDGVGTTGITAVQDDVGTLPGFTNIVSSVPVLSSNEWVYGGERSESGLEQIFHISRRA